MKGLVLVIFIFLVCALVGYELANHIDQPTFILPVTYTPTESATPGTQFRLILIHVDRLDRARPRMVSVWFVSLFYVDGVPPTLTFAQMYPNPGSPERHQAFERSFSLSRQGDPSPGFWKLIRTQDIVWDGYLLVDDFTVQKVGEWINGPGDFSGILGDTQSNPRKSLQVLEHTCVSFGQLEKIAPAPFGMNDFMPDHFRSDLSMEDAMSYWNLMTSSRGPIECDVLLAP